MSRKATRPGLAHRHPQPREDVDALPTIIQTKHPSPLLKASGTLIFH